jgi:hypothetical protein
MFLRYLQKPVTHRRRGTEPFTTPLCNAYGLLTDYSCLVSHTFKCNFLAHVTYWLISCYLVNGVKIILCFRYRQKWAWLTGWGTKPRNCIRGHGGYPLSRVTFPGRNGCIA